MNILLVTQFDIYTMPGTVRIVALSQEFAKRGHQVTLCHCPDPHRRYNFPLLRTSDPPGVELVPLEFNSSGFLKNINRVKPFAQKADIIHVQKCRAKAVLIALWLGFLTNKPVHYDWDDLEVGFVPQWSKSKAIYNLIRVYELKLPRLVDSISYSTEYVKQLALERGASNECMFHAHVGADIEKFNPSRKGTKVRELFPADSKIIAYIGQLEEGSYVDLLIRATPRILSKIPQAKFFIVGGGPHLPLYQKLAQEMGTGHVIRFTNYIPHDAVPDYIAAADVCVACFEDNALTQCKSPLKIAEYLAAGKVIVASAVGDVPFMVEGAGVIVPPGDTEKLAEGIISVLSNPAEFEKMKVTARQKAEKTFNWSVIAERFLDCYQSTIDRFHSRN